MHPGSIPGEASIFAATRMISVCSMRFYRRKAHFARRRADWDDERRIFRTSYENGGRPDSHHRRDQRGNAPGNGRPFHAKLSSTPGCARLLTSTRTLKFRQPQGGQPARFLMEPSPFAKLLQLAEIQPGDAVLDIGCGTGYSSAVISKLAASVIALESDPVLAERAAATLAELGYDNITVVTGPLAGGHPAKAPYDVIFVGGAVDEVPQSIVRPIEGRWPTGHCGGARQCWSCTPLFER